jgi:4,5-DOPA dioxygenase extradiol
MAHTLRSSPPLPVLFIGHGSPMNAIEDNAYRRSWQALGGRFGSSYPAPQLILCISAHWLTRGWQLTGMAQPKTIHDFGGFPQALFDMRYPAPGAPAVAASLASELGLELDLDSWGLDHGTWSVLQPMFPAAQIPVLQLSMDYARPAAEHFALGQRLAPLRKRGVLIVGSGNVVHNLRAMRFDDAANTGSRYDWARQFDSAVAERIERGELAELTQFQAGFQAAGSQTQAGQELAKLAHPSHEHYLPLLYAAGAADPADAVQFFNADFQGESISMRSVIWG